MNMDVIFIFIHLLLTEGLLMVDPRQRPTIHEAIERLQEIAAARNVNLKASPGHSDNHVHANCKWAWIPDSKDP